MKTSRCGLEQQIREVRIALSRLRGMKKFRGQKALVRDTERHLALLIEALNQHDRGQNSAIAAAI
jgi:hypothetical protein